MEWASHLLPTGVSASLSARISQLIDLDWGNCLEHITNIMTNHVPAKVFKDMSILCLGAEFVSKKVCICFANEFWIFFDTRFFLEHR